jgi:DNA-binding transcriptional MerR regulator
MDTEPAVLRIGELSRRLGISDHVLRAWERRYGLLRPVRSAGGFRLYSEADERRVRRMQAHLGRGLSAAEAARAALDEEPEHAGPGLTGTPGVRGTPAVPGDRDGLADLTASLARALDRYDEPAAQALLDRLLAGYTVETVLRDVVLPYLRLLGTRWERGEASVAQEHFASNLLRGRLASLARGWGHGLGPLAVLACVPGEQHELGLLAFGIVLNRNGWRVGYLGPNTPLEELIHTATEVRADLVVLAATAPDRYEGLAPRLAGLPQTVSLALAGATPDLAEAVGARLLTADPVTAAEQIPPPDRSVP